MTRPGAPLDRMQFTILEDGTIKVEIDGISGANHVSAEDILTAIEADLGGDVTSQKRKQSHRHHTHTNHNRARN